MIPHRLRSLWSGIIRNEGLACAVLLLLLVPLFAFVHWTNGAVPRPGDRGWWQWFDQSLYLKAAQAWASFNLDSAQHWYFAGYPILAAPFVRIWPLEPFYAPNLLCLVLSGWLFASIGARLLAPMPGARVVSAAAFVAALGFSHTLIRSFVEPWTTTPTVPLILGALLLGFRFLDTPRPRIAAALGLVAGAVGLFRPTDAAVTVSVMGAFAALRLVAARPGWGRGLGVALAGAAGFAVSIGTAVALHVATQGWQVGGYIDFSRLVGFEWRLVPLRWVMLVSGSAPVIFGEYSLSQAFIWVVPGLAGMVAALLWFRGRDWVRHALTITLGMAQLLTYLAYRDLEAQGLLRYGNYHYVKWVLLLLALYVVVLVAVLRRARWSVRIWAPALVAVLFLFGWRVAWAPPVGYDPGAIRMERPGHIVVTGGLHSEWDGLVIPAMGEFSPLYLGLHTMHMGDETYRNSTVFKTWPTPYGLMLTIRRTDLLNRDFTLDLEPPVTLAPTGEAGFGRLRLVPRIPWFIRHPWRRLD